MSLTRLTDSAPEAAQDRFVIRSLLRWFSENGREFPWRTGELEPWQVLVAEMLLRQTQAWRVAPFLRVLFDRYPSTQAIRAATQDELATCLRPMGLHRTRSRQIYQVALAIEDRGGEIPTSLSELEALPGVGPYVAASYLVAVHSHARPTVDSNMVRVLSRLYGPRELTGVRQHTHIYKTAERLLTVAKDPRLNWAILDFAAAICRAKLPHCIHCPLVTSCASAPEATLEL